MIEGLTQFESLESLSLTSWAELTKEHLEVDYKFKSLKVLGVSDTSADNKTIRNSLCSDLIIIRA